MGPLPFCLLCLTLDPAKHMLCPTTDCWGHCLRLQQPPTPQRPLQRRLHLHVLELGDGEVEVLDGAQLRSLNQARRSNRRRKRAN